MDKYVGHYFRHEINDLKREQTKQLLLLTDRNFLFLLEGLLLEYSLAAKCQPEINMALIDITQDVKLHLNKFIPEAKAQ